jgi:hypothetical protein
MTAKPIKIIRHHVESSHQIALFDWIRLMEKQDARYSSIFAVPNGGRRNVSEAARMKREGVKRGVSDIFVAVPSLGFHGMFLELKRPKVPNQTPPVTSKEQKAWLAQQQALGYSCGVCFGWEEARAAILSYFWRL